MVSSYVQSTKIDSFVVTVRPGKVTNITIEIIANSTWNSYCTISWNAPKNIVGASRMSQSLDYTIELCFYNPLTKDTSNCRIKSKMAGKKFATRQSSLTIPSLFSRMHPVKVPRIRDVAIFVYATALNGKHGKAEQLNVRLDPTSGEQLSFIT